MFHIVCFTHRRRSREEKRAGEGQLPPLSPDKGDKWYQMPPPLGRLTLVEMQKKRHS